MKMPFTIKCPDCKVVVKTVTKKEELVKSYDCPKCKETLVPVRSKNEEPIMAYSPSSGKENEEYQDIISNINLDELDKQKWKEITIPFNEKEEEKFYKEAVKANKPLKSLIQLRGCKYQIVMLVDGEEVLSIGTYYDERKRFSKPTKLTEKRKKQPFIITGSGCKSAEIRKDAIKEFKRIAKVI